MSTLLLLLFLMLGSVLNTALCLWLGAKWARVRGISYLRALGTTFLIMFFALLISLTLWWIESNLTYPIRGLFIIQNCIWFLVSAWATKLALGTTLSKAIVAWLTSLLSIPVNLGVLFLLIRPYVVEPLITPTRAMAPT